ncbi:MAG: tRNA dimethylallyltransferase [Microgenomates bacterium OLB23]|nr:MAG: tRNA dimethylallyltransferase [Microgenomates bacterium OLB23]
MQKAIVVTGQTGTGKTSYALSLAKEKRGEIINADARQIYKHLTIVTGKDINGGMFTKVGEIPLEQGRKADIGYYVLEDVRVWGYDLIGPGTIFSSHDYKVVAEYIIRNAIAQSSLPIIVGGTHFYITHLTQGFSIKVPPNWKLRNELAGLSITQLHQKLHALNALVLPTMNTSDQRNPHRIIRKIEIAMSDQSEQKALMQHNIEVDEYIGFKFGSTATCKQVLRTRVAQRLAQGAVEEVQQLRTMGYTTRDPGLQAIGYKQLMAHVEGNTTLEEASESWLTAEVQYAKRQLSFMKQNSQINWHTV